MNFISTRDINAVKYSPSFIIKQGLADDGGLFFPETIPNLTSDMLQKLCKSDYSARAALILGMFLTDYTADELQKAASSAYSTEKFGEHPVTLSRVNGDFIMELWNGPTSAFKDMALQIMPRLLSLSLEKTAEKDDILILVATSGDTGKAALEGFADVDRIKIHVFYPENGVSDIQKLQMQTQKGENVGIAAIEGNFDDAQNGVKRIFSDTDFRKKIKDRGYSLSSANSINFGRLAPQIVYYISAYCDLLNTGEIEPEESINITVPTGNFGNILAAYMAKKMGLPINKLICASNSNNVLTDFFNNGVYDRNRRFFTTISPSMDILISSNLERLLFMLSDAKTNGDFMRNLGAEGHYTVSDELKTKLNNDFAACYCDEDYTKATIKNTFNEYNYLCDPHTAVGVYAAQKYKKNTGDTRKMLIASTASPYKFAPAMCQALGLDYAGDGFAAIDRLYEATGLPVPKPLAALADKEKRFNKIIDKSEMAKYVEENI